MVSLQENEVIGSASNSKLDKRTSLLPQTDRLRELQTILRDKSVDCLESSFSLDCKLNFRETSHSEFVFSADRLIRLVVEDGLNKLPYHKCTVVTPTVIISCSETRDK